MAKSRIAAPRANSLRDARSRRIRLPALQRSWRVDSKDAGVREMIRGTQDNDLSAEKNVVSREGVVRPVHA